MCLTVKSWVTLAVHGLWYIVLGSEMARFWGMRKKFRIHARSPALALTSGLSGIGMQVVIMIFVIFKQEGTILPCQLMSFSTAIFVPTYPIPYLLRGLRVVIISHKVWREKYSMFLSRKYAMLMMLGTFIVMLVSSLTVQLVVKEVYGFITEPRRHKGELQICGLRKRKKVAVVVDEPQIAAWKEKWNCSKEIMAVPAMDEAFERHVQDFLCSESYDFLREVESYTLEAATGKPRELFVMFEEIVKTYILAGSELEVNIETAMRNKILKIDGETRFLAATAEERRGIFDPSETEIRKMLDENLLKTFLDTRAFIKACEELQAKAEEGSMTASTTIGGHHSHDQPAMMLPSDADQRSGHSPEEAAPAPKRLDKGISLSKASMAHNFS